jgi:hypothetical protein
MGCLIKAYFLKQTEVKLSYIEELNLLVPEAGLRLGNWVRK